MKLSIKQISTALEIEHGHPVIITPGSRDVIFVVDTELEAYKLAYHLMILHITCAVSYTQDRTWHITCVEYLEPEQVVPISPK